MAPTYLLYPIKIIIQTLKMYFILLFVKIYFYFHVLMHAYVKYVCRYLWKPKEVVRFPGAGVASDSHQTWVLGTKPRSSVKAADALSHCLKKYFR